MYNIFQNMCEKKKTNNEDFVETSPAAEEKRDSLRLDDRDSFYFYIISFDDTQVNNYDSSED